MVIGQTCNLLMELVVQVQCCAQVIGLESVTPVFHDALEHAHSTWIGCCRFGCQAGGFTLQQDTKAEDVGNFLLSGLMHESASSLALINPSVSMKRTKSFSDGLPTHAQPLSDLGLNYVLTRLKNPSNY